MTDKGVVKRTMEAELLRKRQEKERGMSYLSMSLRDYFAARAMNLLFDSRDSKELVAERAYGMADAMMEARKQVPELP